MNGSYLEPDVDAYGMCSFLYVLVYFLLPRTVTSMHRASICLPERGCLFCIDASMLTQKGMLVLKTRVCAKMDDAGLPDIHLLLPDCQHSADKHVFGPRSWSHSADVSR